MLFSILTLFPDAVESYLDVGVLGIARARGLVQTRVVDFRDFTRDRHRTVDDRPFGGGPGMVLKPEPIVEAVEWLEGRYGPHRRIALTPDGVTFDQSHAEALAAPALTGSSGDTDPRPVLLLCGRYEGFDDRALTLLDFERLSIGNFVLAGGELGALVVIEAAARLVPGVLGDDRSAVEDSYSNGGGLDHPHFTRPRVFRGIGVPDVLLSGDHAGIDAWRRAQSEARTKAKEESSHAGTKYNQSSDER
ncbi:tRNA (guanine-N(1)-)-methyltransferase [Planctomycetes bacterium Poly30]|uniref:tRNA (guanine-N(1)-)-methyltransferase n=1 Tax=Saltatorellus ferox TaxID=2528018 RepID=A0A518ERC2_9BACT|nr:tRNA (guanine-N(1)-)-methyltransferase [Planctomycetes bacterium Poly30]